MTLVNVALWAQVDVFLDRMTLVTKEDDQRVELAKIVNRSALTPIIYKFDSFNKYGKGILCEKPSRPETFSYPVEVVYV